MKRRSSGWKRVAALLATCAWLLAPGFTSGTGYIGPTAYLAEGGRLVAEAPEFYWETELKRLARDFVPPEKLVRPPEPVQKEGEEHAEAAKPQANFTSAIDLQDFDAALRDSSIKPADKAKASQQHKAARDLIALTNEDSSDPLGEEWNSEFADYHRGAHAYARGETQYDLARQAWEALLKRPPEERHYRSVWAAFMLGKLALKEGDPKAVDWFQKTRALAREGFADSLGMAADSYGWEGRSEWKQGHPEKAAALYLTQLALGDESAIVSLKALIPDRVPVEGFLNYGPGPEDLEKLDDAERKALEAKNLLGLQAAARDPLLRKLVTVHILATETGYSRTDESGSAQLDRSTRWLAMIKAANLQKVEDAEYLGWLAYNHGDYTGAAKWLDLSTKTSSSALWLQAKLLRRAGKLADAAQLMLKVWKSRKDSTPPSQEDEGTFAISRGDANWNFEDSASGDTAALQLALGDFVTAFDILFQGNLWHDAAYVAERVLTLEELQHYVDQLPAPKPTTPPDNLEEHSGIASLRYLLARRYVREDRYGDALKLIPKPYDAILKIYVKALHDGSDAKLPKEARARAWFKAAWIARYDGMELMGTETAPDVFAEGGDFETVDLARERRTGKYESITYEQGNEKKKMVPILLKPTKQELDRINRNRIVPDVRFHYRVIAGALAIKAAALLPDNSPELADVINRAGLWVKDRDDKLADRYFEMIRHRCPKTPIGKEALAHRWFVDDSDDWSIREEEERTKLRKELSLPVDEP